MGLSTGITADLPTGEQVLLTVLMFIGRLGPITVASALALRQRVRMYDLRNNAVVVIGLGRFGRALALELVDEETEVLGIDEDPEVVQLLSGSLTHVVRADSTKEAVLRQLAVHEFDRAVVAIGTDLEASILTASLLVSFGIQDVWAKAISEAHGRILSQLGVQHVVYPEHDMGQRVAHLVRGRMLDYIEFEDDFAMVKTTPPAEIVGQRLADSAASPSSPSSVPAKTSPTPPPTPSSKPTTPSSSPDAPARPNASANSSETLTGIGGRLVARSGTPGAVRVLGLPVRGMPPPLHGSPRGRAMGFCTSTACTLSTSLPLARPAITGTGTTGTGITTVPPRWMTRRRADMEYTVASDLKGTGT